MSKFQTLSEVEAELLKDTNEELYNVGLNFRNYSLKYKITARSSAIARKELFELFKEIQKDSKLLKKKYDIDADLHKIGNVYVEETQAARIVKREIDEINGAVLGCGALTLCLGGLGLIGLPIWMIGLGAVPLSLLAIKRASVISGYSEYEVNEELTLVKQEFQIPNVNLEILNTKQLNDIAQAILHKYNTEREAGIKRILDEQVKTVNDYLKSLEVPKEEPKNVRKMSN